MPLFFNNFGGKQLQLGEKDTVDANNNYVPPGTSVVKSVSFNGSIIPPESFSGNLQTTNGIVSGKNSSNRYNVYALGNSTASYSINFSAGQSSIAYILAVGGGGGGGGKDTASGGGAGGVIVTPILLPTGTSTLTVNVGAGGLGIVNGVYTNESTSFGGNTVATFNGHPFTITAGGGCRGTQNYKTTTYLLLGSGSGGTQDTDTNFTIAQSLATRTISNVPGSYSYTIFANDGLNNYHLGGGGGGAGAGTTTKLSLFGIANSSTNNCGGDGILLSNYSSLALGITDFTPSGYSNFGSYYWGAGGGGSLYTTTNPAPCPGGRGGGGGGGNYYYPTAAGGLHDNLGIAAGTIGTLNGGNGGPNTGSGGGGTWSNSATSGGNGGSGIFVIAFPIGN